MYSVIAQAVAPVGGDPPETGSGYGPLPVMAGLAVSVLVVLVLLLCYLFYRKRLEHRQMMAAIERGIDLSAIRPAGLAWIKSLSVGIALLVIGIGFALLVIGAHFRQRQQGYEKSVAIVMAFSYMAAIPLLGVGISLVLYGFLRRKAERRALAIDKGLALSEIERPSPIMSLWMGAGLLVLSLLLFSAVTQENSSRGTMLFFGVCLAGGVALLVRGCLLRRAERRYLSKEKGIRFSGRRRSKFTKSILLGIGFVMLSLFFLYMVVEEYRRANYIPQVQLLFFAVLFTLGVVFFVRAGLVRRPRGRRAASSAKVDASESSMASR